MPASIAPIPPTPAAISSASAAPQNRTIGPTWLRSSPCRSTKRFWAPIAMMSAADRAKPDRKGGRNSVMRPPRMTFDVKGNLFFFMR